MGSPEEIIMAFRTYRRNEEDTTGQFLGHYHALWLQAEDYGVEGVEGIMSLISMLPREWRRWATHLVRYYIDGTLIEGVLYGDFRGFIATISHRYYANEDPPPGPFDDIEGLMDIEAGLVNPQPQDDPVPFLRNLDRPIPNRAPLAPSAPIFPMTPPGLEAYCASPYNFTEAHGNFEDLGNITMLPNEGSNMSSFRNRPNYFPDRLDTSSTMLPQTIGYDSIQPYLNFFSTPHDFEAGPSRPPNHVSETEKEEESEEDPVEYTSAEYNADVYGSSMMDRHWTTYNYPPVEQAHSSGDECSCTGDMHGEESQLGKRLHLE